MALYWLKLCHAQPDPLTIRVLGKDRDVRLDVAGGSQIPRPGARDAPSPDRAKWRHHVRHQNGDENGVRGDRLASSAAHSGAIRASPASSVMVSTLNMIRSVRSWRRA